MTTLFGTDGVRGVANIGSMAPQEVLRLGFAAGLFFKRRSRKGAVSIVIGRDTRISGPMIEGALVAGLTSAGVHVLKAGVLPTPAVSYLVRRCGASGGGVVSASHNRFDDNGVKFFGAAGEKLTQSQEEEIESILSSLDASNLARQQVDVVGAAVGSGESLAQALEWYETHARSTVEGIRLCDLKIVVDCANGAASRTTPEVLAELGAQVVPIHHEPDGININANCGSLHADAVAAAVLEHHAAVGITHDGDADRCLMVDERGGAVDGDLILAMCARHLMARRDLPGNGLVATVMSNLGLDAAMQPLGVRLVKTQVGDRHVKETMDREGLVLGGEPSGHIIHSRLGPTGDGLLTALQVLRLIVLENKPLSELHRFVTKFPQVLVNVKVRTKKPFEELTTVQDAVRSSREEFKDEGRVVLRYSGTEPLARVMVEGPDASRVRHHADRIALAIQEALGVTEDTV